MSKSKEIAEEYASSLADLAANSKPVINMLTIIAEENIEHAEVIVAIVEKHLAKVQVDIKLPVFYLVDSIIKNVGGPYIQYFSQCIINMFSQTFQMVGMEVRPQMFDLRNTWHGVFSASKLYQLDVKINLLDPAWPVPAQPPVASSIHVTPIPNIHLPAAPKSVPIAPVAMVNPVPAIPPNEVDIKPVNQVSRHNNVISRNPRLAKSLDARCDILRSREAGHLSWKPRQNCAGSSGPDLAPEPATRFKATLSSEIIANTDVHLRVIHSIVTDDNVVPFGQKKPSPESSESTSKKIKPDNFNVLFGNEDVDLRKLPQVEENTLFESLNTDSGVFTQEAERSSPLASPGKDSNEDKEQEQIKKTINVVMNKANEQYSAGHLTKNQYKSLVSHVQQLKEKLKQIEAEGTQSLHSSKLKHEAHIDEKVKKISSLRASPKVINFGDIDNRAAPTTSSETNAPIYGPNLMLKSGMEMSSTRHEALWFHPSGQPFNPEHPAGRGGPYRSRLDNFTQRPRGVIPPHFRGKFTRAPRFDTHVPFVQPIPTFHPLRTPDLSFIAPAGPEPMKTGRKLPRLDTHVATSIPERPALAPVVPDVHDLFAKLVATGIINAPAPTEDVKEEPRAADEKPNEDRSVINRVDLTKPKTLRVSQPALVAKLYDGMQCSSCGIRFLAKHTAIYSRHLDWHFLQNHHKRQSTRPESCAWYRGAAEWLRHDLPEDSQETKKNWFEIMGLKSSAATAPAPEPPSAPAGPSAYVVCALCGDTFQQFFHDDHEEWHLRNAVCHEGQNYHPLCLKDYKASLLKRKSPKPSVISLSEVVKSEESIDIKIR